MKNFILLVISIFLLPLYSIAQQYCATDELHQQLYQDNPGIIQKVIETHNELEAFTQDYIAEHAFEKRAILYTIPVVFHVIHLGGAENISNAQIYDQMRIINEDYQKLNADTANTIPAFQSIATDCQIEFKLAHLDPDGNCTSGITRHFDARTSQGNHDVKDIVHWDPTKYLNIYVCNQAAGLAGHALVPSAADTISEWDGIVIAHNYVGDIGTSDPSRSVVLTHEIGHYLNLQHVWGGNNVPGYPYLPVADAGNCAYDDDVTDTPNTIGWQSCNTNHQSCGTLDNVQNFMEYAYCPTMFTEGQKLRMHAALNSSVAGRNNLWSQSNLTETGVYLEDFCQTDFESNKTIICEGETIEFGDISFNNIQSRQWSFEGGVPATSADSTVLVVYNTPGKYQVKLISGDGTEQDSLIIEDYVTVLSAPGVANSLIEGFETSVISNQLIPIDEYGGAEWSIYSNTGYQSDQCLKLNNIDADSKEENILVSSVLDFTNINDLELKFDYAFAKLDGATATEILKVYSSNDCGATWSIKHQVNGVILLTHNDPVVGDFIPTDQDWKSRTVTNISSSNWTNEFRLKFEFTTGSGNGNNFYLDNINLFDPNMASINLLNNNESFSLFPNPADDQLFVKTNLKEYYINIYNQIGQKIQTSTQANILDISNLEIGVYLLEIVGKDFKEVRKFIKQ